MECTGRLGSAEVPSSAPRAPSSRGCRSGHCQPGAGVPCRWGPKEQVPGLCRKRGHLRSLASRKGAASGPRCRLLSPPPSSVMWTTVSPEAGAEDQGAGAAPCLQRGCSWRISGGRGRTQGVSRGCAPGEGDGRHLRRGPAGAWAVVLPTPSGWASVSLHIER